MSAAVHTSTQPEPTAPPVDLFGPVPTPLQTQAAANDAPGTGAHGGAMLQFQGVLARAPEIRNKAVDREGHFVPVLCVDLDGVGPMRRRIHAEQPFTEATRPQAERLARQFKKGDAIQINTSPMDVRLFLPAIDSITLVPPAPEAAPPAQAPTPAATPGATAP